MNIENLLSIYGEIERTLGRTVIGADDIIRKDGTYVMVPFSPTRFVEYMKIADGMLKRPMSHEKSFVDVGAGLGFKVVIAQEMGFDATGIEYDKKYVDFAVKYLGFGTGSGRWPSSRRKLVYKNALDVDYKNFDIIYFYRPIAQDDIQRKLEKQIISTMRDDAIVIAIMPSGIRQEMTPTEQSNWGDNIYIKKGCEKHFNMRRVAA
jgi:hypothetical protein